MRMLYDLGNIGLGYFHVIRILQLKPGAFWIFMKEFGKALPLTKMSLLYQQMRKQAFRLGNVVIVLTLLSQASL
jgi:hypothetical protein